MKPENFRMALAATLAALTTATASPSFAHATAQHDGHAVVLGERKFPYPYKAMLAISSDADSETLRKFNLVHEFINTNINTPLGKGLGLDFSDSFFMYNGTNMPGYVDIGQKPMTDEMSWYRGVSDQWFDAAAINHYIHVGWIDTMHTFGDFSMVDTHETKFSRALARRAIAQLNACGDHLMVWTDHGNQSNVDNFGDYGNGSFYSYQQGANPWSPYYHTDLAVPYGIHFVWPDTHSDQFGMSSMIYPLQLPDGRRVWGFWRYTSAGQSPSGAQEWNWTPYHLDEQLSQAHLDALVRNQDYSIIAQHLCGTTYPGVLPRSAVDALERLAQYYREGKILVTRTSRLLVYNVSQQYVSYCVTYSGGQAIVHVWSIRDPVLGTHVPTIDEIRGLTFYTTDPQRTVIEIGDVPVPENLIQDNPTDGYAPSVEIEWWPADTNNYAVSSP